MQEKKIALIGSAPSSIRLAPYNDPSWEIWGCSPGAYGVVPRVNMWFELHRYEPGQPWFSPEYCQWLAKANYPIMMAEVRPEIPQSVRIEQEALVAKYGPYFFTSSLAWMMAMAIEAGATKIGLWGVDMAANEEYAEQRQGVHYFAQIATAKGIEVGVPPESCLFRAPPLYGVCEIEHGQIKMTARRRELESRLRQAEANAQQTQIEAAFLRGAMDDMEYHRKTWVGHEAEVSPPKLDVFHTFNPE